MLSHRLAHRSRPLALLLPDRLPALDKGQDRIGMEAEQLGINGEYIQDLVGELPAGEQGFQGLGAPQLLASWWVGHHRLHLPLPQSRFPRGRRQKTQLGRIGGRQTLRLKRSGQEVPG